MRLAYKPIEKFPNYLVNENGDVHSLLTNKLLSPSPVGKGYLRVCLRKNNKTYGKYIHQIVAETFIPKPDLDKNYIVNHKDGDKLNNHIGNLEWVTYSENNQHAYDNSLKARGEGFYSSKLRESDVNEILQNGKYATYQEIADRYGVTKATIRDVLLRRSWKYIQLENSNDYSIMEVAAW